MVSSLRQRIPQPHDFAAEELTQEMDRGDLEVVVPSGWSAPSTTPKTAGYATSTCGTLSVSGRALKITGVTLAGGAECTITYGSESFRTRCSGTTTATDTFKASESSTATGTVQKLSASPKVTVYAEMDPDHGQFSPASVRPRVPRPTHFTFSYEADTGGIDSGDLEVVVPWVVGAVYDSQGRRICDLHMRDTKRLGQSLKIAGVTLAGGASTPSLPVQVWFTEQGAMTTTTATDTSRPPSPPRPRARSKLSTSPKVTV